MSQTVYDTIIIGGGPAGAAAAVYAARKKLKTLIITENFGGQSIVSGGIENWIGEEKVTGLELAEKLEKHVRAQEDIEVIVSEKVVAATETSDCPFKIITEKGKAYQSKTLIIASGARRRRLNIPGEDIFDGKGVAFCSTCDAPFFKDQDVAVVGSGNSALETVLDLFPYAKNIYLLIRRDKLKGDPVAQEKVTREPQVKIIANAEVQEILGEQMVTGLRYKDNKADEIKNLQVGGVFVEIGSIPNSEFVRDLIETNEAGEIVVDHQTAETSKKGIFAAGDVTSDPFKQNNIAAGDGVRAALSAYNCIQKIKKCSPCLEKGE
ncbi:MAG: NAD(P)/FAD-dependent oxidoreductase [Thermodesulfobacteriota bacterium]